MAFESGDLVGADDLEGSGDGIPRAWGGAAAEGMPSVRREDLEERWHLVGGLDAPAGPVPRPDRPPDVDPEVVEVHLEAGVRGKRGLDRAEEPAVRPGEAAAVSHASEAATATRPRRGAAPG